MPDFVGTYETKECWYKYGHMVAIHLAQIVWDYFSSEPLWPDRLVPWGSAFWQEIQDVAGTFYCNKIRENGQNLDVLGDHLDIFKLIFFCMVPFQGIQNMKTLEKQLLRIPFYGGTS